MTTIKSYTDIEQSKKLVEILPLESADMYYWCADHYPKEVWIIEVGTPDDNYECICAWSLAALLGVLPKSKIYYSTDRNKRWYCECWDKIGNYIGYTKEGSPIDACVAMIEKLHELNML